MTDTCEMCGADLNGDRWEILVYEGMIITGRKVNTDLLDNQDRPLKPTVVCRACKERA